MEILKALLLGLAEGITEWLPVSSTGHLLLLERLLRPSGTGAFPDLFRVVIQLGAVPAAALLFFRRLRPFTCTKAGCSVCPEGLLLWRRILIACIPAAAAGLLLGDWLEAHFYNSQTVALMLILYGLLFLAADRNRPPARARPEQITDRDAWIIGLWQAAALIPGTSRSGATIVGGLLLGLSRPAAAQFSFCLAIPVTAGAGVWKLLRYFACGARLSGPETAILLTGTVSAFAVSLLTIRLLLRFVQNHSFRGFGWYRIILGLAVLVLGLL